MSSFELILPQASSKSSFRLSSNFPFCLPLGKVLTPCQHLLAIEFISCLDFMLGRLPRKTSISDSLAKVWRRFSDLTHLNCPPIPRGNHLWLLGMANHFHPSWNMGTHGHVSIFNPESLKKSNFIRVSGFWWIFGFNLKVSHILCVATTIMPIGLRILISENIIKYSNHQSWGIGRQSQSFTNFWRMIFTLLCWAISSQNFERFREYQTMWEEHLLVNMDHSVFLCFLRLNFCLCKQRFR